VSINHTYPQKISSKKKQLQEENREKTLSPEEESSVKHTCCSKITLTFQWNMLNWSSTEQLTCTSQLCCCSSCLHLSTSSIPVSSYNNHQSTNSLMTVKLPMTTIFCICLQLPCCNGKNVILLGKLAEFGIFLDILWHHTLWNWSSVRTQYLHNVISNTSLTTWKWRIFSIWSSKHSLSAIFLLHCTHTMQINITWQIHRQECKQLN